MSCSDGFRIIAGIFLLIFKGAVVSGQTAGGPNAVVFTNGQTMLDCVTNSLVASTWTRTPDGTSNVLPIAFGCSVTGNNAAYYRTEQPGGNICRLIIANVTMQQAGVYICNDGLSTTYRSLVTMVDPAASIVVYNQTEVVEGDQLNISCSINYNGPASPAPSLRPSPYWTTSPGQIYTSATYYTSTTAITLVATVTVQKPTVPVFQCKTVFSITGNTSVYNPIPPPENFTLGATTERDVQYGPSTPTISRGTRSFTSKDGSTCTLTTLTCTSTAKPSPSYKWKDVTNGNQLIIGVSGNVFDWAEDNRTYECTATNNIRNVNRSMSETYTVGVSSSRPCVSVNSNDISICSDDGRCDTEPTTRSCSNGSHIYLTCNISQIVYPKPTRCQWKDANGNVLSSTYAYNATMNGDYTVLAYNEINEQTNTSALANVRVTDCCPEWKLIVSVIIPWIGECLIATIIFIVCYATLATPFRAKMLNSFSWLEYMLPCVKNQKVEPQRAQENIESPAPTWKIFVFVVLLILVSVTCGIVFFPILITIAYCCPRGEASDGQNVNRSAKKGKPIYMIPLIILMWFGVVALMFPLTFVLVYFIHCDQMTFRYVVTR